MASNSYWLLVVLLFLLWLWAGGMFYKYPSWALAMLLPLMAWLLFDPAVLALGNWLGEGPSLQVLTYLRHLLRALAMPFLLVVAFDQAKRARVRWTDDPLLALGLGMVIVALLALGLVKGMWGLQLVITESEGIKQYKPEDPLGLPWAALGTAGLLALLGAGVLAKTRTPWLLLGGLAMLVSLFPLPLSSVVLAASSLVLVLGILLTEIKLHKIAPPLVIR